MSGRGGATAVIIILVLLLATALILSIPRGHPLDRSAIGVDGLTAWLNQNDVPARRARDGREVLKSEIALQVVALYDIDLRRWTTEPEDGAFGPEPEEWAGETTLRNGFLGPVFDKIRVRPAVILLPKWRGDMVAPRVAHARTLIGPQDNPRGSLVEQLGVEGLELIRPLAGFRTEADPEGRAIGLFHPQLFERSSVQGAGCETLLGFAGHGLVIRCDTRAGEPAVFVSDPDLMNNHGLATAENAAVALALLKRLRGDAEGAVYVDPTPRSTLVETLWEPDERDAEELSRLIGPPFTLFVAAMMAVILLAAWRGMVRFGPAAPAMAARLGRSRAAAVAAEARILRLSQNDGPMVADFVRGQLHDLAARRLGPEAAGDGGARLFAHLARRDEALAEQVRGLAHDLIQNADGMPPAQLHRRLDAWAELYEKVANPDGPH